jgi:hypothetical protein
MTEAQPPQQHHAANSHRKSPAATTATARTAAATPVAMQEAAHPHRPMRRKRRANTQHAASVARYATSGAGMCRMLCQLSWSGGARRVLGGSRRPVGDEHPAPDQRDPQGADQPRPPGPAWVGLQHPPHPHRAAQEQQPGGHEVGDLDPAQLAVAEQADRVPAGVEPVPGEHLEPGHHDKQRPGDCAAGQQHPGQRRGRPRGDARPPQGQ